MIIRELLYQFRMLNKKIEELRKILLVKSDNDLAKELISLIDQRQSKLMALTSANKQAVLNIGEQEISITTAITIRDTIKLKIDTLTDIIVNSSDFSLDRLALMKQRDKLYEDFTLLDIGILKSDLNTSIED